MIRRDRRRDVAWVLMLVAGGAQAQGTASASASVADERAAIGREVDRVKVVGPAEVVLKDQARLALPAARLWIPQPVASRIMQAMGNRADERLLGLVAPPP
jgi:uncharacterized membrane-anchored protein